MKTAREIKEKYSAISQAVCEGYQDEQIIKAMEEYAEQFKQPTAQGWECPRCHKIHSWLHMECDCPPKVMTATTNLQPEITDEDIVEWAKKEPSFTGSMVYTEYDQGYKTGLIEGAKAMRDGKITKK